MKNIIPLHALKIEGNRINEITASDFNYDGKNSKKAAGNVLSRTHVGCFNCGFEMPADPSKTHFENFKEFVVTCQPYMFLMFLEFVNTSNANECFEYADDLLENVSRRIFGVEYRDDGMFTLDGFAFVKVRKQEASCFTTNIVINMLIKYDSWYDNYSLNKISGIFDEEASKVLNATERGFTEVNSYVSNVRGESDIESCFDTYENEKLHYVTSFGEGGLFWGVGFHG